MPIYEEDTCFSGMLFNYTYFHTYYQTILGIYYLNLKLTNFNCNLINLKLKLKQNKGKTI